MATKTLIIDGDRAHFLLAVDGGTLRVGDDPAHTEGVIRDLRVVRVRCEVEFEDDRDHLPVDEPGVLTRRSIRPGTSLQVGHAHLSMAGTAQLPALTEDTEQMPSLPATGPRRLKVIDGGDQGQTFPLPDAGTVTVGKSGGPADVGLHDLYVTRVHCSLAVTADGVTVTHRDGPNGTLVDGQKIAAPRPLRPGSVVRVGNSHLRLEVGPFADAPPPDAPLEGPKSGMILRAGGSAVRRAPAPAAAPAAPAPAAEEPRVLGHYRLGKLLGRGFTAEVFEATHDQSGQVVALKVFAPEFPATPAEVETFAREMRAAQTVRHPNLVTPYSVGRTPARCWLAREFVPGEAASAVVARVAGGEKPSWTRAARVVVHLARALDALHQAHVVHGNITPKNVLLRDDHATKLADLRLTQALAGSQLRKKVAEPKLLAELAYLAPEQADPDAFVDESADLYAVGAVAYALIAGRPPVGGTTPEEILDNIQAGRVIRPGAVYKKVPPAFDAVVLKLLAHNQEDRYPTAAAVLADMAPLADEHDLKLG